MQRMAKAIVFEGKKFAAKLEEDLKKSGKLSGKKLLIYSEDPTNVYVRLKKEFGERMGVDIKVTSDNGELTKADCDGVLVQLPVKDKKIIDKIPVEKDVDGMTGDRGQRAEDRGFLPAAVVAIEKILKETESKNAYYFDIFLKTAVVGAKGTVGSAIVGRLRNLGYVVREFDKGDDLSGLSDCDIVISAVGEVELIKPSMLMDGVVVIDLGFPKGDFTPECAEKAAFFTPVPGGVGPVTIACLFESLSKT